MLKPYTVLLLKHVVIPAAPGIRKAARATEHLWRPAKIFIADSFATPGYFKESVYGFCYDSWQ